MMIIKHLVIAEDGIGRALNVLNRIASINQREIDNAFIQAQKKGYALVGFASHDFRDLEYEVKYLDNLIKKSYKKFKNVEYKFCEAKYAFQSCQIKGKNKN